MAAPNRPLSHPSIVLSQILGRLPQFPLCAPLASPNRKACPHSEPGIAPPTPSEVGSAPRGPHHCRVPTHCPRVLMPSKHGPGRPPCSSH